jgi:hypothetical protein
VVTTLQVLWRKYCIHFTPPMRGICPSHDIFLDLITLIIYDTKYKLLSSPLCNFLYPFVTFSLWGPYILLSSLFSKHNLYCVTFKILTAASMKTTVFGNVAPRSPVEIDRRFRDSKQLWKVGQFLPVGSATSQKTAIFIICIFRVERETKLHAYTKSKGKIIVLYIFIFTVSDRRLSTSV